MRTFVLSDIHGYYNIFLKMLEKIRFSDDDFMYVIGDVIDRGDQGIAIIKDLMQRKNVEMFLGNHELMMLNAIDYQRRKKQGLVQEDPFDDHLTPYELWTHPANGGNQTFDDFYGLSQKEQDEKVVAAWNRKDGDLGQMQLDAFIDALCKEIRTKSVELTLRKAE